MAPDVRCRRRLRPASPKATISRPQCARQKSGSLPRFAPPIASMSALATGRSIIFTNSIRTGCSLAPHSRRAVKQAMANSAWALPVTSSDIDSAAEVLAPFAVRTPLLSSPALDERTGARVFLKPEMLQRTGSFKFRGAFNKLASIPQGQRAGGVVAFSSGNHAQGGAAAAKLLDMQATIVMPVDAPLSKRERTKSYGAEVVLYDRDREDREAIAREIAGRSGATLVPPYDDPLVIAGQGTAGREIAEDMAALGLVPDIVVAPASGGGLIAGVATAVKAKFPQAQIVVA